jgi:phage shock protein A
MNIFSKIFSALKSGANEMGESLVDANAITIFEQEICDAKAALASAKESEISLLAQKRQAQGQLKLLEVKIQELENNARLAMDNGNEPLALETAGHIVRLQEQKQALNEKLSSLQINCDKMSTQTHKAQVQIKDMENQLSQVKATDTVHKAQESIHASLRSSHSPIVSAKESLARIKEQQAYTEAKIEVSEELENEANLDKRLAAAGKNTPSQTEQETSAQEILNTLTANKK